MTGGLVNPTADDAARLRAEILDKVREYHDVAFGAAEPFVPGTSRVPYGGRSPETIERYSVEIGGLLLAEGAKMIVVACNTASALGIPKMQELFNVPIVGVIQPGARAAVAATRNGRIGVIGTRATIYSRAYERAIHALKDEVTVSSQACPLLVPLIEEGWLDDTVADQVIARYLDRLVEARVDTLVLGCTHYPLLSRAIQRYVGPDITLVDSARNCALEVQRVLKLEKLSAPRKHLGTLKVELTDHSTPFLRVAEEALGLQVGDVRMRIVQGVAA